MVFVFCLVLFLFVDALLDRVLFVCLVGWVFFVCLFVLVCLFVCLFLLLLLVTFFVLFYNRLFIHLPFFFFYFFLMHRKLVIDV